MTFNTIYNTTSGLSVECRSAYNIESLKEEWSSFLTEKYGASNWLITPTTDLPTDFSVDTYTIVDGQLVPAPAELIAEREAVKAKAVAVVEIKELQAYLTSTDYAAIKCGELGVSMADTYPDLHAGRTAARARINTLQEGGAE